ncbi:A-kinase anchor protein 5 [Bagarius yarrelli]|uniref:A-kinase anchor protein 5 n=1 Tax=Bagarius yarrelli TaxID=175774 RepID=A0A556TM00_BAGYA|nr:A-kinase anchor protein 5 [Bagarius yarrelli]
MEKYNIGQMEKYDIGQVEKYNIGQMEKYDIGQVEKYKIGQVEKYKIGQVEKYKIGQVEKYKIGQVEKYKIGQVEIYKIGQVEKYNIGQVEKYDIGQVEKYDIGQVEKYNIGQVEKYDIGQVEKYKIGQVEKYNIGQDKRLRQFSHFPSDAGKECLRRVRCFLLYFLISIHYCVRVFLPSEKVTCCQSCQFRDCCHETQETCASSHCQSGIKFSRSRSPSSGHQQQQRATHCAQPVLSLLAAMNCNIAPLLVLKGLTESPKRFRKSLVVVFVSYLLAPASNVSPCHFNYSLCKSLTWHPGTTPICEKGDKYETPPGFDISHKQTLN